MHVVKVVTAAEILKLQTLITPHSKVLCDWNKRH